MQYKFRKDQRLIDLEEQRSELVQLFIIILVVIMILIALIIIGRQRFIVRKQHLLQTKLELENQMLLEELENKKQSLQENVKYLVGKNELITNVLERLIQIKHSFTAENQNIINEVIIELQSSIDDGAWDEFEVRFNQIHNEFYIRLSQDHPELTSNDKKLCAFLRLNMTTKEISAITNQTANTLETARTRLRKKLNLHNKETSLYEYLNQY
jgi:DNA-binding CsgD family transcriptional regulator